MQKLSGVFFKLFSDKEYDIGTHFASSLGEAKWIGVMRLFRDFAVNSSEGKWALLLRLVVFDPIVLVLRETLLAMFCVRAKRQR